MQDVAVNESEVANFPERLKVERERLGLSQEEFGRLGGVSKMSQWSYEAGKNWPTVEYLESLRISGVDVRFLVTGNRQSPHQLDWNILRQAYLFVHHSFASREDRNFSADQLFDVFKSVVEASMGFDRVASVQHAKQPPEDLK